jgi:uncharacterized protein YjbI with pentapeptide repeats
MLKTMLKPDCESCFGLCCVALPYAKSADFPSSKESGTPCTNLQQDFRCKIHSELRVKGFRGCIAYECFGAGQKVSQEIYGGSDWRSNMDTAEEMFTVFPIMQQIHEMLFYINEAMRLDETRTIYQELAAVWEETLALTNLNPQEILQLNIDVHRNKVNDLLLLTSNLFRENAPSKMNKKISKRDLIGAKLRHADLRGESLRGAILIAADLRDTDMRFTDCIGADFRDADLSGANLSQCLFLTQAQVNSARGNRHTKLPPSLNVPTHWVNV